MATAGLNGHPTCHVPGCEARVHGNGLCRRHFDEERYLEATGQSPEAQARRAREQAIEGELSFGPRDRGSVFSSDEERRAAWEQRKDKFMNQYVGHPYVGLRPWAWWRYVAQREEHVTPYPPFYEGFTEDRADALDEYELDPIVFLAAGGYLTDRERATIEARAAEARPRIGTDDEHIGTGCVERADRRAVKHHDAVYLSLRH